MADNYIERQYEDYQARKAAWESQRKHTVKKNENKPAALKRRVFVTGGAQGIGRAIVKAFREKGYQVAFCDHNAQAGVQTAKDTGAAFHEVDVADASALENCMKGIFTAWGDVDILINNVGMSVPRPLTQGTVDEFDRVLAVNLRSAFVTSRTLATHRESLEEPNPFGGRIVNICSTRYQMSEPGWEAYAASKGGIYSLTHALALSLSGLHITVNSISPGWIETGRYEDLRPIDHAQHPSGRVGKPEDVARICLFLCDEANDFMNGENITVDGGMTHKMIYEE